MIDPKDRDCLETPTFLNRTVLSQYQSFVLIEVEPLIVEGEKDEPKKDELLVIGRFRLVQDKGEVD